MDPTIPEPLQAEHAALHARLVHLTRLGGRTGETARAVARLLHPHFEKEEAFALPPLGLLAGLAQGEAPSGAAVEVVLGMTERLRAELPEMLDEHRRIVAALDALVSAAQAEGERDAAAFAEALKDHARTEEEVLYPAAILLGERLRQGAARPAARARR